MAAIRCRTHEGQVDVSAALAAAQALGCAPDAAAELVMQAAEGVALGIAKRRAPREGRD